MPTEPDIKRAVVFIDGQNLFYAAKIAFGHSYPSLVPHNKRGINGTDWIKIDNATYAACLDTRDYRPKKKAEG